jgi:hypothetical protein
VWTRSSLELLQALSKALAQFLDLGVDGFNLFVDFGLLLMISSLIGLFQNFLREIRNLSLKSNHNLLSFGVSPVTGSEFFISTAKFGCFFIFLGLFLSSIITILLGSFLLVLITFASLLLLFANLTLFSFFFDL